MLNDVKQSMHILGDFKDAEILENISAALEDLRRRGVSAEPGSTSHLVLKAVELYCKWIEDYMGYGERWYSHYEKLAVAMSMAEDYASEEYWNRS